jgi:hypothetical protein
MSKATQRPWENMDWEQWYKDHPSQMCGSVDDKQQIKEIEPHSESSGQ